MRRDGRDSDVTELARRVMTHEVGEIQDSEGLASSVVAAHAKFLTNVSSLVGVMGSTALLRRSLMLTHAAFPFHTQVLEDGENDLLNAVGACWRQQAPDLIVEASVALLTAYLELLASFIGGQLTRHIVLSTWPELLTSPSVEEKPA